MKAILVNDDKSLRWDDVPNPVLKDNEVLVKVEYAALNRADLMQREGDYPPPPGAPEWMGLEVSGTIAELGQTPSKTLADKRSTALMVFIPPYKMMVLIAIVCAI